MLKSPLKDDEALKSLSGIAPDSIPSGDLQLTGRRKITRTGLKPQSGFDRNLLYETQNFTVFRIP